MMFIIFFIWLGAFAWGLASAKATAAHYATIAVSLLLIQSVIGFASDSGYGMWTFERGWNVIEGGLVSAAIGLCFFGVGHLPRSIIRRLTQRDQPDAQDVFG